MHSQRNLGEDLGTRWHPPPLQMRDSSRHVLPKFDGNFDGMQYTDDLSHLVQSSRGFPAMSGGLPAMSGGLPAMSLGLPAMSRGLPAMSGGLPAMSVGLPVMSVGLPSMSGGLPAMSGGLPAMSGGLPAMSGGIPAMSGGLPAMSGGLPAMSGGLPAMSGGLPVMSVGLPAMSRGLPVMSGGLPAMSVGLPAMSVSPLSMSVSPLAMSVGLPAMSVGLPGMSVSPLAMSASPLAMSVSPPTMSVRPPTMPVSSLDEPSSLLGLTLRKTPSLLDLISMKLTQGNTGDQGVSSPDAAAQEVVKNRARCAVPAVAPQDKLKASNFPASSLKVGNWERVSRYEGDLVGKCYYAKRKLVWEVLESGLKSKIEIQWSDISAMKASCLDNLPGTLEIELSRSPLFFRETNPQPRKHTLWQGTTDFTGGEASMCKRHSLQFPEGVLNRHYEKLLQCDPRLKSIVDGTHTISRTPEVDRSNWLYDGNSSNMTGQQSMVYQRSMQEAVKNQQHLSRETFQMFGLAPIMPARSQLVSDLKPEVKMHSKDLSSPSSVMDNPRGSDESSDTDEVMLQDGHIDFVGEGLLYAGSKNFALQDLPDVKPPSSTLFGIGESLTPNLRTLDDISRALLDEPSSFSGQARLMALNQQAGFLPNQPLPPFILNEQADFLPNEQVYLNSGNAHGQVRYLGGEFQPAFMNPDTSMDIATSSAGSTTPLQPFRPFEVKSEMMQGDNQLDSILDSPMKDVRMSQRDPSFSTLMSCYSDYGSAGDLLNIPRVASLPQLFDSNSQVASVRYDSRSSYLGS